MYYDIFYGDIKVGFGYFIEGIVFVYYIVYWCELAGYDVFFLILFNGLFGDRDMDWYIYLYCLRVKFWVMKIEFFKGKFVKFC